MRFASGWTSRFSAMRHRDFRYLWLGNSIVMGGNQATFIAASYLAYELTDSAFILGLVSIAVESIQDTGVLDSDTEHIGGESLAHCASGFAVVDSEGETGVPERKDNPQGLPRGV